MPHTSTHKGTVQATWTTSAYTFPTPISKDLQIGFRMYVATSIYKERMYQWLLVVTSDPAAKGSAKDLEVLVQFTAIFPFPPCFLTMCSSERYLSYVSPCMVHRPS